jgi:hypothetical protein
LLTGKDSNDKESEYYEERKKISDKEGEASEEKNNSRWENSIVYSKY